MDAKPTHLFVVEDDPSTRELICSYLTEHAFTVTALQSTEEMLRRIDRNRPDLIIMDISLPGLSGLDACLRIRATGDRVPIILLTARIEEIDRVLGLEMGADDYLGKPFSPRELLARIRAILRRSAFVPGVPNVDQGNVRIGRLTLEAATRRLIGPDRAWQALTTVEYALLVEFVHNPMIALSRERLLAMMHGRANDLLPRTVDVAVMRLRKIIEPNPSEPRYIQTVRKLGYMFVPDVDSGTAGDC